jgi:peptide/nickel transport system permease protein
MEAKAVLAGRRDARSPFGTAGSAIGRLTTSPTFRYSVRRILQAIPTVLLVGVANFLLLRLAPGDMADVLAGEAGAATPGYMAQLRAEFGLDQSLWVQFYRYATRLLHFDLGYSFRYNATVFDLIVGRLGATVLLMAVSISIALSLGVLLGTTAARFRGTVFEEMRSVVSTVGFAVPLFWVGMMAIVLFSVHLGWLPIGGMTTLGAPPGGWVNHLIDTLRHLVLPATTLSIFYVAIYARFARSAVLEVSQLDFVRTARAKGISEARVLLRHVLRNALLSIVTLTGYQLGSMLSGSIVVETVFAWPGLGRLAFDAVAGRDFNLLLGIFFCNSLLVILMNVMVDLTYAWLDPRIEVHS